MKRQVMLCLLSLALLHGLMAQINWASANMPGTQVGGRSGMFTDSTADVLYYIGNRGINGLSALDNSVLAYSGGTWSVIDSLGSYGRGVIVYHDTLLAGISHPPYLRFYDGSSWQAYGQFDAPVYELKVIDDTLYALGAYTVADGQVCHGLARREGGNWQPVNGFPFNQAYVYDAVKYQGQLVVTGQINDVNARDVAVWDGTSWSPLGGGLAGSQGSGECLAIYQGDLYLGGAFRLSSGNAGHGIMRWDGQQWNPVGLSVTYALGNYQLNAPVFALAVHNDLLYVGGGFNYAGGLPASKVATWNGHRWCSLGGTIVNVVEEMAFYHDTLFVAGPYTADSIDVEGLAKYIGSAADDSCEVVATGVVEVGGGVHGLRVLPGVVAQGLPLVLEAAEPLERALVLDAAGRVVHVQRGARRRMELATAGLAPGLYTVAATGAGGAPVGTARCAVE